MKRLLFLLLLPITACSVSSLTPTYSYYFDKEYVLNEEKNANVANTIMAWEYGTKTHFSSGYDAKDGYRFELIYTGISQNVIYLLYREFSVETKVGGATSYIRPAFSHEYRYDVSRSKLITFREIKIQIIEATSESLKYSVISGAAEPQKKYGAGSKFQVPIESRTMILNLKDGSQLKGVVIEMNPNESVVIKTGDGTTQKILWDKIASLKYE